MTAPTEAPEITAARQQAQRYRAAHELTASHYAASVARVAALMVRAQMPTAAVIVFAKDEETVTGDTSIDIVKILDANGVDLGELTGDEYQREIEGQLETAYDATGGAGPFNIGEDDNTEEDWTARNILELDIPTILAATEVY